jgi:hypothetical protein
VNGTARKARHPLLLTLLPHLVLPFSRARSLAGSNRNPMQSLFLLLLPGQSLVSAIILQSAPSQIEL